MSLPPAAAESLTSALRRISVADDTTAVSRDLAGRFRPPGQANPANELGQTLSGRAGRGLFGSSKVWVTETPVRRTASILGGSAPSRHRKHRGQERDGMTDTHPSEPAPGPSQASVPEGLVAAVVNLVGTGPVLLGAYTIAELTAVDAVVDFLEARPSDEVLTEAIRSLVARQLIVAGPPGERVQVRGDLGIAVAFEQRARMVMDAARPGQVRVSRGGYCCSAA